jgi:hypothetical protein
MNLKYGLRNSLLINDDQFDGCRIDTKSSIEGHCGGKVKVGTYPDVDQHTTREEGRCRRVP